MQKLKILFFIMVFFSALAVPSFALPFVDDLYANIKEQTTKGLEASFNRKVKIKKISGRIIGAVLLEGVSIGDEVHLESLKVEFNPIKFIANKGNIVPAITKLTVQKGRLYILRDKKGRFVISDILKKGEDESPPLTAKIILSGVDVVYEDKAGMPYKKQKILSKLEKVKGEINFAKAPKMEFNIKGINEKKSPISLIGSFDGGDLSYNIKVSAKQLSAAAWVNYFAPEVNFSSGSIDVDFEADAKNMTLNLKGIVDSIPVAVKGRIFKDLDLILSFQDADVDKINKLLKNKVSLEAEGLVSANVLLSGHYGNPKIRSIIVVRDGSFFGTGISGSSVITYADKKVKIESSDIKVYKGRINVYGEVALSGKSPIFNINGKTNNVYLPAITQNAPGVEGYLTGDFRIKGSLSDLKGTLSGVLGKASLWGQPLNLFSANIRLKDGYIEFEQLKFASDTAEFIGKGQMSPQKEFSFHAEAKGLKLSGAGPLGPMGLRIDKFFGDLAFNLNDEFLKNPLKNLTASGSIEISKGFIGKQLIKRGGGEVSLSHGKIQARKMFLQQGESTIFASGETGVGVQTDLMVLGKGIYLKDLGIIRQFFSLESLSLEGTVDFYAKVNGFLSNVKSFEDVLALNVSIEVNSGGAKIDNTHIKLISLEAFVDDGDFNINYAYIKTESSEVYGSIKYSKEDDSYGVVANLQAKLDLKDIQFFTQKYGVIEGQGILEFEAVEKKEGQEASLFMDFKGGRFNDIVLDKAKGKIELKNKKIRFVQPLELQTGKNEITCLGDIYFGENPDENKVDIKLSLKKGDVNEIIKLLSRGYKIYGQFSRSRDVSVKKVNVAKFDLPKFDGQFFEKNRSVEEEGVVWDKLNKSLLQYKLSQEPPIIEAINGEIKSDIKISGKLLAPNFDVQAEIKNGSYKGYDFDKLNSSLKINSGFVTLEKAELKKSEGAAAASGFYDLKTQVISVEVAAKDMPVDVLMLLSKKEFIGKFNAKSEIRGTAKAPIVTLSFGTSNVKLADVSFDGIKGYMTYADKVLTVKEFTVEEKDHISALSGMVKTDGLKLSITLEGHSLGLVNLFNDEFKWMEGDAVGNLNLFAKEGDFSANGNLSIKNGVWHIKALNGDVGSGNVSITANGKKAILHNLSGSWYGGDKAASEPVSFSGYVDWGEKKFNLSMSNGKYYINVPNVYRGNLSMDNMAFSGVFDSPKLIGRVTMMDSIISLPTSSSNTAMGGGKGTKLPILLDLDIDITKNVYLTAGNVNTIDLSNIFLNMEIYGQGIKASGLLTEPNVYGRIYFKRGSVSIFNREFTLLSSSRLESFYPLNIDSTANNYAEFSGRIIPDLNLFALVKVEDTTAKKASSIAPLEVLAEPVKKEVVVVSHITGIPFSKDKNKALNVDLDAFQEDVTTVPSSYKRTAYSKDEIRALLLPDFVKSAMGLNNESLSNVETNAVVADYLNSRLQTVVFRGIERQLEQVLGLESLTLEYNFGKDLRKALGAKDTSQAQTQSLGVGFVKEMFDRFYIDIKYARFEDSGNQSSTEYFNYQLTYRLTQVFSFSYYREPLSINEPISGFSKTSLKATFGF